MEAEKVSNKISNEEIEEIKALAAEHFDGDLRLGVAAFVRGLGMVKMVGASKYCDADTRKRRGEILRQINQADKPKPKKATAKKKQIV